MMTNDDITQILDEFCEECRVELVFFVNLQFPSSHNASSSVMAYYCYLISMGASM